MVIMMLNSDIALWATKQRDLLKEARCGGGTSYFVRVNGMKYYFMWKNDKGEFQLEFYLKPYVWGHTVSVALGLPNSFNGRRDIVFNKEKYLNDCYTKFLKELNKCFGRV